MKRAILISVGVLLAAAGVWFFYHPAAGGSPAGKSVSASAAAAAKKSGAAGRAAHSAATAKNSVADTNGFANRLAFRLTNTKKTIGELQRDRHAILLENAFIDTSLPLNLNFPSHLQSGGDPGAYLVQANGKIDNAFRAALAAAGAQIVSYIPNNAYLVRLNAGGAQALASNPLVQTVLPYEPYYKISSSAPVKITQMAAAYSPAQKAETNTTTLLQLAVAQKSLPPGTFLTLGLFGDDAPATIAQIEKLGGRILSEDRSPFGKRVRVQPPADWTALADLSGVQLVEPAYLRKEANDLARVTTGVSTDTVTNANYLGLTGSNVMVEVNDTGIDPTHPDFSVGGSAAAPGTVPPSRVFGDTAGSLYDTSGHGTHVAGIIAGNGSMSLNPTPVGAVLAALNFGSVSNADMRGKAPNATLFSVGGIDGGNDTNPPVPISDSYFQEAPALTNALISNNSWANDGDNAYDLSAASYDAATRDALPGVTGSQPVLFVFAAGNDGAGSDDGGASVSGTPDSITSPGTAKNVITVGALEQPRNITNIVTVVDGGVTNTSEQWAAATDTGYQVAGYSSRGNVGIETEGTYGRFKPDVVAPGTFVVSTRSSMWDTNAYYNNPTNYNDAPFSPYLFQTVTPGSLNNYFTQVPDYAVGVYIQIVQNVESTSFFTNLPMYISLTNFYPSITNYDIYSDSNNISIPPDVGGGITDVVAMRGNTLNIDVGNNSTQPVNYDLYIVFATTNNVGDYYQVLEGLNNQIGPYYRYESGTSMATPAVSGVLADMQDFFTNTLHTIPSPALLKAMLINGSRATAGYNYQVQNAINFEGWGLVNLPNSIPATLTNSAVTNMFFVDQSPTNALATGDSQTYGVVLSPGAEGQSFRVTLAWTDPPGNPAAAIKLVNNLELVVTNLDDPTNPVIFYGNDIAAGNLFNTPETTNTPAAAVVDTINNVQNVYIRANSGTNFTVTVIGAAVNVNAVNAQTNDWTAGTYAPNIVQDFALVIASGDGPNTNGFTITGVTNSINPLNDQNITVISTNNSPLLNQFAGASSPILGTNNATFAAGSAGALYGAQAVVTISQTNQCHFYIVTNNGLDASTGQIGANVTNAAFVTFSPATLAIPREGVYADSDANSTLPEANLNLYVTTDSNLLTLSPVTISNCINSGQLGATIGSAFQGSALARGGSQFIVDTNSQPGEVYYVCVQSEDQVAAEYDYLAEFSSIPFSTMNNGDQTVNFFPVTIPGGNSTHPGVTNTLGLAIYPVDIQRVVVTNYFNQQNAGDIIESLSHSAGGLGGSPVVLYNHASPNQSGIFTNIYDDSGQGDIPGAQTSAGPGTLKTYFTQQGSGVWLLQGSSDAPGFSTTISATMFIQHHQDMKQPNIATFVIPGQTWAYGYVDVPVGTVNLTVLATNVSVEALNTSIATPAIQMYLNPGSLPTISPSNYLAEADLTNSSDGLPFPTGVDPWNQISTGPPLTPGIYYVGFYNPSADPQEVQATAVFPFNAAAIETNNYVSAGPLPLLDDAVTYASMFVTNTDVIQGLNIGLRVDHPRISDLAFTLIDPEGDRYLLMENRGGTTTNGCGATIFTTNIVNSVASGDNASQTNVIDVGESSGTFPISYNFYTVPDEMTVYYGTNLTADNLIYDSGFVSYTNSIVVTFPPATATEVSSNLTIVMNQFGNTNGGGNGDLWTYSAGGIQTNYLYLSFTEDTNLTITPIKFAPVPLVPDVSDGTNYTVDNFESIAAGDYTSGFGGWSVVSNQVSVVADTNTAYQGNNYLALANGAISTNLTTVPGTQYTVTLNYRGPGIVSWWRGENNAVDSVGSNNGSWYGSATSYTNGEVGQAFNFNGSSYVQVPDAPDLRFTNAMSVDTWVNLNTFAGANDREIISKFGAPVAGPSQASYTLSIDPARQQAYFIVVAPDTTPGEVYSTATIPLNQWVHIAGVYDGSNVKIYINGQLSGTTPWTKPIYPDTNPLAIGCTLQPSGATSYFNGSIDEVSLYNRAFSDSEIKAIYQAGTAGKFDANIFNSGLVAQSLAEASVQVAGISNNIVGNNSVWQQQTITFTATQTSTPLVISGIEPGVLLDNISVSSGGSGKNLYYQPEQPLSPLIGNGVSAYGNWQLEILDSRAGASNNAVLDSWQLQFTFANPNFTQSGTLTNGMPVTNTVYPNGIFWLKVKVPVNADIATNSLLFANLPLNVLFSTNVPPTTNGIGDTMLIPDTTNGVAVLGINGSALNTNLPAYIVPGGTYYIGLQNTNTLPVLFGYVVTFHFTSGNPWAFTQPATAVTGTNAQLNGMATPNGNPSIAWFQWGSTTNYGNITPPVFIGAASNVVYVASQISGLLTNTPYHFQLVISNAVGVVSGFDQIFDEANVAAWGADYVGQINVPAGLSNVVAIAGAYDHSLAIKNNGVPVAWGDNSFGQSIIPAGLSNVVAVAGGEYYSMVLQTNGTVTAWGLNNFFGVTNVPAGLNNVVTIAGGTYAALALQTNGAVVAWGANFSGQTNVPAGLSNCVAIAGGSYHSLAVRNDGTVVAWGDNSTGQTNIPAGLNNVVAIACGDYHSLALRGDGTVVAWGDNSAGQTNVPPGLSNVVAVAAGGFNSEALLNNGTLVSWGDNSANQSIPPLGLTNIIAISSGYLHSLALTPLSVFGTNSSVGSLTGGAATNSIFPHAITYYLVTVPTNADFATNLLYFAQNGPLNIWFSTNNPPTIGATNDTLIIAGQTNGTSLLTTNGSPLLVPGGTYYLGVNNTNSFTVTYGIAVNFHLIGTATNPPPSTNAVSIGSIVYTNISGTNGFLLTWFAPSNDLFVVQFTDSLTSNDWTAFTNIISYNPNAPATAASAQFNFFDNGSEFPFGTSRFYRVETLGILGSAAVLTLPAQSNLVVIAGTALTVTNAATDLRTNITLTYTLTNSPSAVTNPVISTNGVITWTPPESSTNVTYTLTTIVTDSGSPSLSATNSFMVLVVAAAPSIGSVNVSAGCVNLQWTAPTNEEFQVQWATNLAPPITWFPFTNIITSTTGAFSFMDTNTAGVMKFYELILLP